MADDREDHRSSLQREMRVQLRAALPGAPLDLSAEARRELRTCPPGSAEATAERLMRPEATEPAEPTPKGFRVGPPRQTGTRTNGKHGNRYPLASAECMRENHFTRVLAENPDRRCRATSKQTGQQCRQPRREGMPTCWYHGSGGQRRDKRGKLVTEPPRSKRQEAQRVDAMLRKQAKKALDEDNMLTREVREAFARSYVSRTIKGREHEFMVALARRMNGDLSTSEWLIAQSRCLE